jgi:hypothetical protein
MKHLITPALLLSAFTIMGQSNREIGLGYTYMAPAGQMQHNIQRGHGFTMDYYIVPNAGRFGIGAEFNYTLYGYSKTRQLYSFDDGTQADMDIVVNNSITTFMLGGRYYLRDASLLRPYVNLKAGYSIFTTDLNIYDPSDWDNCEPIDTELLIKDGTLVASAGAGVQYDLSGLFKRMRSDLLVLNLSVNLTMGGRVNYMNTDAPTHHHPSTSDVTARFINTQTQIVHDHHVGYVYTSYAEMVDMRAGLVLRITR